MKKIGIIIQARMGSTRFPGKILKPFYNHYNLIDVLLHNLHKIENAKIVIATSNNSNNDVLEKYLKDQGENVFRGSENDVLERYIQAAEHFDLDGIVRICSDNPFLDWRSVARMINKAQSFDGDYLGYRINGTPSILTHFGFWGEYVTIDALRRAYCETDVNSPAHEHVTYHIYNHPSEYKCKWIDISPEISRRNDIRLTVDTPEDLKNASIVYNDLNCNNRYVPIEEVIEYLDKHEDLKKSMISNIKINKKQ